MTTTLQTPYRIAIRSEGEWINAYLAPPTTMEGALHLASVKRNVAKDKVVFDAFKLLCVSMSKSFANLVGLEVSMHTEEDAPEHEKAGRA